MAVIDLVKKHPSIRRSIRYTRAGVKSKYENLSKYENFIGGRWVPPLKGKYFTDYSPINSEPIGEIARSSAEDVEKALDAAHRGRTALIDSAEDRRQDGREPGTSAARRNAGQR